MQHYNTFYLAATDPFDPGTYFTVTTPGAYTDPVTGYVVDPNIGPVGIAVGDGTSGTDTEYVVPVPEPATNLLLGGGLICLICLMVYSRKRLNGGVKVKQ